jgi:hypothetical protein
MEAHAYLVYVKVRNRWRQVCTVKAASHPEALRKAIAVLAPEHYDKPIKVERVKPPRKRPGK